MWTSEFRYIRIRLLETVNQVLQTVLDVTKLHNTITCTLYSGFSVVHFSTNQDVLVHSESERYH